MFACGHLKIVAKALALQVLAMSEYGNFYIGLDNLIAPTPAPQAVADNCRYAAAMSDTEVPEKIQRAAPENTRKKNPWAVSVWADWRNIGTSWVALHRRLSKVVEDELKIGHPRCMLDRQKCVESLEPLLGRIKGRRMCLSE